MITKMTIRNQCEKKPRFWKGPWEKNLKVRLFTLKVTANGVVIGKPEGTWFRLFEVLTASASQQPQHNLKNLTSNNFADVIRFICEAFRQKKLLLLLFKGSKLHCCCCWSNPISMPQKQQKNFKRWCDIWGFPAKKPVVGVLRKVANSVVVAVILQQQQKTTRAALADVTCFLFIYRL